MRIFEEPDITELHDRMCTALANGRSDSLDYESSVDVQVFDVVGLADRMEWEFDLKWLWLTKQRWNTLVRQYLDPEALETWLDQIEQKIRTKKRGIAVIRTKTVASTTHGTRERRRWGSCILALSYRGVPEPQLSLWSRTSYLGYLSALDLTVAWHAARLIAERIGIEVEEIKFAWHVEAIQFHGFKSLAYLLSHPLKKKREWYRGVLLDNTITLPDDRPALELCRQWIERVQREDSEGVTYGEGSSLYGPYRRIRRRFHAEVFGQEYGRQFEGVIARKKDAARRPNSQPVDGHLIKAQAPLPSVWVSDLDFKAIGVMR